MIFAAALASIFIASVNAGCDNYCSGHGNCQTDDVCACYDNWGMGLAHDSGDCSQRICPYELAWVDNPDKTGSFHKYAECSGRGICDTSSGECLCFDGYEGKACSRMSCPNDCSGHGTCEYIEDLPYGAVWEDYSAVESSVSPKTFWYHYWDNRKIRGCVCDAQYGDVDCSKRLCPYGNDVLDVRDNLLISTKYQTQNLKFIFNYYLPTSQSNQPTFALKFKSKLNETYTTTPIVFSVTDHYSYLRDLRGFSNKVQLALLNLPNKVIDGVTVASNGVFGSATNFGGVINGELYVNVTFTGNAVQGPQHPLVIVAYECGDGCQPKITGLDLQTRSAFAQSNYTEVQKADYNSYECGRRGKCDYKTGLCQCFSGYTGENCNTLESLV